MGDAGLRACSWNDFAPGERSAQVFNAYGVSTELALQVMDTSTDTGTSGGNGKDALSRAP